MKNAKLTKLKRPSERSKPKLIPEYASVVIAEKPLRSPCGKPFPLQEVFAIPEGIAHADDYVASGGEWDVDLHYTGTYSGNPKMIAALNAALPIYAESIAACHHMPLFDLAGTFSLELVFKEGTLEQRRAFRALIEYHAGAEYWANEAR